MALKSNCTTLAKVGDSEEIFILRAQDASAARTVLFWIGQNLQASDDKLRDAFECALRMRRFPNQKPAD